MSDREADRWLEAASRRADAVAEPTTDSWWATLFAELDARMSEDPIGGGVGDGAERRAPNEAALRRLAEERRLAPRADIDHADPRPAPSAASPAAPVAAAAASAGPPKPDPSPKPKRATPAAQPQ